MSVFASGRFVHWCLYCRAQETELLEPLIPSILLNLEHRHPYVRRNAVLAVMSIYKLPGGEHLLQDAGEVIEKLLLGEQDLSAKRNAFLMLATCAQVRACDEAPHWILAESLFFNGTFVFPGAAPQPREEATCARPWGALPPAFEVGQKM